MISHFQSLKGEMNKLRENERIKLTKLTLQSNKAIKDLNIQFERVKSFIELLFDYSLNVYNIIT